MIVFLADSNIWLEGLLKQAKAEEVKDYFRQVPKDQTRLSEFSLYTIGIHLVREQSADAFLSFVNEVVIGGPIRILKLNPDHMQQVVAVVENYRLDFNDAYQYVVAENHDLRIVSFDADFDRTPRGRLTPPAGAGAAAGAGAVASLRTYATAATTFFAASVRSSAG